MDFTDFNTIRTLCGFPEPRLTPDERDEYEEIERREDAAAQEADLRCKEE